MAESVLVIGYNSRVGACSAARAGWEAYSLGHHADRDLLACVRKHVSFGDEPADLRPFLRQFDVDCYVLGAGFEGTTAVPRAKVLGNDPRLARDVANKVWLAQKLDELGVPQPELYDRENVRYPCIAKPVEGGGGHKNYVVHRESELPGEGYFLQELVRGKPLSTCVFSTGSEAVAATVNEILVGKRWLGTELPYCYCGNVTPYITKFRQQMAEISERLIPELGLVGTNGIDFVVDKDGPKVLEINPRFQGSLDAVEIATGGNVFQAHADAVRGRLPRLKARRFGYRAIQFARGRTLVAGDLMSRWTADVPPVGQVYRSGDAILTLLGRGRTRGEAAEAVRGRLRWARARLRRLHPA